MPGTEGDPPTPVSWHIASACLSAARLECLPRGALTPATPADSCYTRRAFSRETLPRRTWRGRGTRTRGLEGR
jgi:hypothetical protein